MRVSNYAKERVCTLDIETDGLDPTKIWIVNIYDEAYQSHTPFYHHDPPDTRLNALEGVLQGFDKIVVHHGTGFDFPVLSQLWGFQVDRTKVVDTLVLSKLLNVRLEGGHSLEAWGERLKFPKVEHEDWTKLSSEMIVRCQSDCELTLKVYRYLWDRWFHKPEWHRAIECEHTQAWLCQDMHDHGFPFNMSEAEKVYKELSAEKEALLLKMQEDFPPKEKITVLKTKIKRELIPFNPNSPKQVIERIIESGGWKPTEKTDGHKLNKDKEKKEHYAKYGWKLNERNLASVHSNALDSYLRYTILESRLSTLTEWFSAYRDQDRSIHGLYDHLGAWTHRKTHSKPNMGNIPAAKSIKFKQPELYDLCVDLGKRLRSLWWKGDAAHLLGCDAEGIQLRVFASIIKNPILIKAITEGKKEDGTDIHSVHKKALGDVCKTRDASKTFIYAFFLGASPTKVAEIFGCSKKEAVEAIEKFLGFYPELKELKTKTIPKLAAQGWFEGLDGRKIVLDGEHTVLAAMLQSGESIVMKHALNLWHKQFKETGYNFALVNDVHDEYVTLSWEDEGTTKLMGKLQCKAIEETGKKFNMFCPLAGSYQIGSTWHDVH